MGYQLVFKRHEVKYLLTDRQVALVRDEMGRRMRPDEYGRSTLCNLYFDTPSYLLIRTSLDHPLYKEKLRVRSYGVAGACDPAFVEIKKKCKAVVYKRRLCTTRDLAMSYMSGTAELPDSQIAHELGFALRRYEGLAPRVFLSYEREAFFDRENRDFRITFDTNVLWRDYDLSLGAGVYGESILPVGATLMEVKAGGSYPLWVCSFLSRNGIFPARFSKYGTAYRIMCGRYGRDADVKGTCA